MRKLLFGSIALIIGSANVYAVEGGGLSSIHTAVGMSSQTPMTEEQCLRMSPGCTATLIAPNAVLTAAHCVNAEYDYQFKACDYDEYNDTNFYIGSEVKEVIVHPEYFDPDTGNRRDYDIAIHILEEPVTRIEPIAILQKPLNLGEDVTMMGYGLNVGADNGYKRIGYNSVSEIFDYRFRTLNNTGAKINSGDSGGPALVYDDNGTPYVAGVASISSASWSGYVNVPAHVAWITQIVESSNTESASQKIFLKSAFGQYLVNEQNGGDNQTVNANRDWPSLWEEMTIEKLQNTSTCIRSGDDVSIRSGNGTYWTATSTGELNVDSKTQGPSSSFAIVNHTNPQGCLNSEDSISLRSNAHARSYVVAEWDGNANVNRTVIGDWEKFTVIIDNLEGH